MESCFQQTLQLEDKKRLWSIFLLDQFMSSLNIYPQDLVPLLRNVWIWIWALELKTSLKFKDSHSPVILEQPQNWFLSLYLSLCSFLL